MSNIGETIWLGVKKTKRAALRFPFMSLAAFLAFAFTIVYHHFYEYLDIPRRYWLFLIFEAIAGIAIFFSFMVFSERNQFDIGKRIGFGLLGFCILGLHFFALPDWAASIDSTYFLRFFLLVLTFICLATFIVFNREGEQMAFWRYNQYLLITFIVASVYSLVLFLGIAGAVFAVESLFDLTISNAVYIDILVFFGIFVNTLFFSSVMPNNLSDFEKEDEYKNALRLFVQYVLLPIVGIYLIILLFYFGKMLIASEFPRGLVCFPILIFSFLSILCYLLVYPIRKEAGYGLVQFFCKHIFYFLLPLLVVYFIAMAVRIIPYGLTEWRYMGLLLGVWLALVSLFAIFDQRETLIFFPVSLFILLVLGSAGPWGMFQMSARSQNNRLSSLLKHEKLLVNKVLDVDSVPTKLNDSLQNEVSSITKFLFYREKIELVYPILAEDEKKQIDAIQKGDDKIAAFNTFLANTFRLEDELLLKKELEFNLRVQENTVFNVGDFKTMTPVQLNNRSEHPAYFIQDTLLQSRDSALVLSLKPLLDSLSYNISFEQERYTAQLSCEQMSVVSKDGNTKVYAKELTFFKSEDSVYYIRQATILLLKK